jgi:hypothetical protein
MSNQNLNFMSFDGTEGEQISLQEGAELNQNYRNANPNKRIGHLMGEEIINQILAQPGCKGIRFYYGLDSNGKKEIVLVGTDANGNDMVTGIIADKAKPCPIYCSSQNPLNS